MSTLERIKKEYKEFNKNRDGTISLYPTNDSFYNWKATIMGPPETPYEGGIFHLTIDHYD